MKIWCKFGKHSATPAMARNQSTYFTKCSDCGADLIARSPKEPWRPVPHGFTVRWREAKRQPEASRRNGASGPALPAFKRLATADADGGQELRH